MSAHNINCIIMQIIRVNMTFVVFFFKLVWLSTVCIGLMIGAAGVK